MFARLLRTIRFNVKKVGANQQGKIMFDMLLLREILTTTMKHSRLETRAVSPFAYFN